MMELGSSDASQPADAAVLNLHPHHAFTIRGVRVSRNQETRQRENQDGVKNSRPAQFMPTPQHGQPPC
jgi:hypothetical protein